MQSKDNKLFWADDLRAFATIAVIILHVSSVIVHQYGIISNGDWWIGNIFDSSVRFCVPIFLMLTGALILPKTYELFDFLKKRVSRILYPFVFWSLIYIIFNLIQKWQQEDYMNAFELSKYVLLQLMSGASYHLWYVYLIIGIYLIFPIISKWIANSTKTEITYYVVIWIIAILIKIPLINKFKPNIDLQYFLGYLGYPILGYLLTTKFLFKKIRLLSTFLIFAGISITIIGTYLLAKNNSPSYERLYSYLSPNVIITSIGVFLFFSQSNLKNEKITNLTKILSKYSYGIYLSHVFVLILLSKIGISCFFINPFIGIISTTILCLSISLFVTYMINKFPYGTYISG